MTQFRTSGQNGFTTHYLKTIPMLLVLLSFAAACSGPATEEAAKASAAPSVILISIDGLRADALASYGAADGAAPAIDALAAESARFDWAFAQSPEPLASTAAILTALYPTSHGMVAPGDTLIPDVPTLAEAFAAGGYETAVFTSGGLISAESGLAQGFAVVGDASGEAAQQYLRDNAGESFFLMLHLGDTDRATVRDEYATAVASVDAQVAGLMETVRSLDLDSSTVIALVSSHGSDFSEHEVAPDEILYATVTRVPMMVRFPGGADAGVVPNFVEAVDLMPTMLDVAGVQAPDGMQGASLIPVIHDEGQPPYIAFGESDAQGGQQFVALGGYRMLVRGDGEVVEFYHIEGDPTELENIATGDDKRIAVLLDHLDAWKKMVAAASYDPDRKTEELDDDTLEQLKSLGYIQ